MYPLLPGPAQVPSHLAAQVEAGHTLTADRAIKRKSQAHPIGEVPRGTVTQSRSPGVKEGGAGIQSQACLTSLFSCPSCDPGRGLSAAPSLPPVWGFPRGGLEENWLFPPSSNRSPQDRESLREGAGAGSPGVGGRGVRSSSGPVQPQLWHHCCVTLGDSLWVSGLSCSMSQQSLGEKAVTGADGVTRKHWGEFSPSSQAQRCLCSTCTPHVQPHLPSALPQAPAGST